MSIAEKVVPIKRTHIRFEPDPLAYSTIDFDGERANFEPTSVALILEEAPLGGCGIVTKHEEGVQVGSVVRVKVGEMAPLKAVVRGIDPLRFNLVRMGLQFLE